MIRAVFLVFLTVPTLFSQIMGGITQFPPQLKQHLELTDEQVNSIVGLNSSLQAFQLEKLRRTAQVHLELSQESAKPTLDPMALGVRYVELEAIRREIESEQNRIAADIQNVLTPAQRTKVQALQQAMQLQSVICEAQAVNLLSQAQPVPALNRVPFPGNLIPASRWFDTNAFLLPAPVCAVGIRTGSFTGLPVPAPQP